MFWRFAYRLYARRQPSIGFKLFTIVFMGFMALIYTYAVSVNATPGNAIRLVVAMLIVGIGFAHRRVRMKRAKGPQALYAKAVAQDG